MKFYNFLYIEKAVECFEGSVRFLKMVPDDTVLFVGSIAGPVIEHAIRDADNNSKIARQDIIQQSNDPNFKALPLCEPRSPLFASKAEDDSQSKHNDKLVFVLLMNKGKKLTEDEANNLLLCDSDMMDMIRSDSNSPEVFCCQFTEDDTFLNYADNQIKEMLSIVLIGKYPLYADEKRFRIAPVVYHEDKSSEPVYIVKVFELYSGVK